MLALIKPDGGVVHEVAAAGHVAIMAAASTRGNARCPLGPRYRRRSSDDTLINATVRADRWRRRIESGRAKSITDLAEQEGVTLAFVCRLLPLTCLAPDLVEAILDGRLPKGLRLAEILGNGPLGWEAQRRVLAFR